MFLNREFSYVSFSYMLFRTFLSLRACAQDANDMHLTARSVFPSSSIFNVLSKQRPFVATILCCTAVAACGYVFEVFAHIRAISGTSFEKYNKWARFDRLFCGLLPHARRIHCTTDAF